MTQTQLEVDIYQIVDDAVLKCNRTDGTGWEWSWSDWQRDWMNATQNRSAYRCLPLTIVNQTGWWIRHPVGFSATWRGDHAPGNIDFQFDIAGDLWKDWINNQFGEGIITWNTPFLFRTRPEGSRLLVCGPANYFKRNAHPLTALIESDWMSMSFTMNWKLMTPGEPVRFEAGEPLFQAIPLRGNACGDLEGASVTFRRLGDDPEMNRAYYEWHQSRKRFHEMKAQGEVKPDEWQKDYFQGRDVSGRELAPSHMTKVKPPQVRFHSAALEATYNDQVLPTPTQKGNAMGHVPPKRPRTKADRATRPSSSSRAAGSAPAAAAESAAEPAPAAPGQNGIAEAVQSEAAAATRRIDDDWRRWIAENILLGASQESMLSAMTASGISRDEGLREVERAAESPYVKGAQVLRNRITKRDWLLSTYRKINRLHPVATEVPRRHRLGRQEFLELYYSTNRPVIITGMMDDWPALRKWSIDYFAEHFGDREVEVQCGRNAGADYEVAREKYIRKMKFAEFLDLVRTAGVTNDFYLTANNTPHNQQALPELWDDIVQLPEYLDGSDRRSGLFWMGPAGTITPFHHDLTNNFMAQVIGRKRVKISPSWDIPLMDNHYHVFSRVDGRATPARPVARLDQPQVLDCILNPGEVLFLPIGCMHYVEGIDVTVTIAFTNFLFDNDFRSFYTTYHAV